MMSSEKLSEKPFIYKKLPPGDNIRILRLRKPKRGAIPRVVLEARSLKEANDKYTAVSYAWGDPNPTRAILINDVEFQVGENLFQFLTHAPRVLKHLCDSLWIDAICINQSDTEEKNQQVQVMGRIYEQASRVSIWLGTKDRGMETLFKCLRMAAYHAWKHDSPVDLSKSLSITTRKFQKDRLPELVQNLKAELAQTLEWLFQNDYWKRTWIVQECLLAREGSVLVCCGKHDMSLDALMTFQQLGLDDNIYQRTAFRQWARFAALFSHGEGRAYNSGKIVIGYNDWYVELFALLQHIRIAKCSILHDKVFGILSLVQHNPKHERVRVDYEISIEELFFRSLACWTSARLTVRLAVQLMANLNLDIAQLQEEVQRKTLSDIRLPPIEFLLIRLGTVLNIETRDSQPVPLGTPIKPSAVDIRFDGVYSPRLDLLASDWLKTHTSTRSDHATGISSCPVQLGDVIFAFLDSMACLVFRRTESKFVKVGSAILSESQTQNALTKPEPEEVIESVRVGGAIFSDSYIVDNSTRVKPDGAILKTASILSNLEDIEYLKHVEVQDDANEIEFEVVLDPLATMCVLGCHSDDYDWPPQRCVKSQRHLRNQY